MTPPSIPRGSPLSGRPEVALRRDRTNGTHRGVLSPWTGCGREGTRRPRFLGEPQLDAGRSHSRARSDRNLSNRSGLRHRRSEAADHRGFGASRESHRNAAPVGGPGDRRLHRTATGDARRVCDVPAPATVAAARSERVLHSFKRGKTSISVTAESGLPQFDRCARTSRSSLTKSARGVAELRKPPRGERQTLRQSAALPTRLDGQRCHCGFQGNPRWPAGRRTRERR